jgi:transposase InsO family protein
VVAWDVAEREEAQIAADLVSRACLRERISKGRPSPLILHADNGNAMRAATLESRLEELGVLRCFFRPRVRNDNPTRNRCSTPCRRSPAERLIPAGLPQRPFQSVELACAWVAAFVDWYNHQHRHSGIRFVTPDQRHRGQADAICQQPARVYEQARQRHPRRWSRSTRCWRQPEVVWINPPPPDNSSTPAQLAMAA